MRNLFIKSFVLWMIVGFINVFIIKGTAIGEVILTISVTRGWGIHTFDLLIIPVTLFACIMTIFWYVRFRKQERSESNA